MIVHHLQYSILSIIWLLEELHLEYEIKLYQRSLPSDPAPADFVAVSPSLEPCFENDGIFVYGLQAIVDYVLDLVPQSDLRPDSGKENRIEYLQWFNSNLQTSLTVNKVLETLPSKAPWAARKVLTSAHQSVQNQFVLPRVEATMQRAEQRLSETQYLAGSFTAADITALAFIEATLKLESGSYPHCQAYVTRLHGRPAIQRALQRTNQSTITSF
jgi:glutathione S-transferase